MQDLKNIIESLLFVAEEPLTIEKLRNILETVDGKEIRAKLQELEEDYNQRGGGFWLKEVAGGWQIRSRPEYNEWIKRMLQPSPQRLSRAALETLAVVAYKQPIIRADIEHIRGVDCGGVLRQLMERKLIRVLGRKEIAGRPLIYATTKLFLEMFELKDLNDLPTPKEIAEFGNTPLSDDDTDMAQADEVGDEAFETQENTQPENDEDISSLGGDDFETDDYEAAIESPPPSSDPDIEQPETETIMQDEDAVSEDEADEPAADDPDYAPEETEPDEAVPEPQPEQGQDPAIKNT